VGRGKASVPRLGRVHTDRVTRWLVPLLGGGMVALLVSSALARQPAALSDLPVLLCILMALLVIALSWRCYRAGLYFREHEAVVVNIWRTHRVPWENVSSFFVGPGSNEYDLVYLKRIGGGAIPITGTGAWPWPVPSPTLPPQQLAAEFDQVLLERREGSDQVDVAGSRPRSPLVLRPGERARGHDPRL
jgi:hypothetical protein